MILCGAECVCWRKWSQAYFVFHFLILWGVKLGFAWDLFCFKHNIYHYKLKVSFAFADIPSYSVRMLQFHFISRYILISLLSSSLTHWLFKRVCCLISMYLWVFPVILISSFISFSCSSEKDSWYVFLNLRLVLWPEMWSPWKSVLCVLENNVYSAAVGWVFLYIAC